MISLIYYLLTSESDRRGILYQLSVKLYNSFRRAISLLGLINFAPIKNLVARSGRKSINLKEDYSPCMGNSVGFPLGVNQAQ
jgi:hypothetical protein